MGRYFYGILNQENWKNVSNQKQLLTNFVKDGFSEILISEEIGLDFIVDDGIH